MLKNKKQAKSQKRKEVVDLLVGKDFLVRVPVGASYKKLFKSEVEDYDLAIKGISALIAYLEDHRNKIKKKSITHLINYLDDHIKIDEMQLKAEITLGGQVQVKLDRNKQLKMLFQSLLSSLSTDEITKDTQDDILKNQMKNLANAPEDNENKINAIIALTMLKEEHLRKRKELNAMANHFGKGSEFDTVIFPLFLKIENIKKSKGTGEKEGKKKAEKRFEEIEKTRFENSVQAKVDAEINALDEEQLSSKIKNELKNRIKNEEKMRMADEKKKSQKKYLFLTREERDNITTDEINNSIRRQIKAVVGPVEANAIKKVLQEEIFDKASLLQAHAKSRHPVLAIHKTFSETPFKNITGQALIPEEISEELSIAQFEVSRESKDFFDEEISLPSIEMSHEREEKEKEQEKGTRHYTQKLNAKRPGEALDPFSYGLFKPIKDEKKPSNDPKIENEIEPEKKHTHKA